MRREAVVDTNAIIYYVVEDSPMHVEAETLLDGLDVWHMPTVVIHELVWFFKKAAPEEGVGVLKALLEYEKAVIHCEDATTLRGAVGAGLTHYNDAVVILTAKKLGIPLVTFDARMAKRAKAYGVSVLRRLNSRRYG
ncbi:MAG: PIN domain-containing protein [Pyrobaculum sp.]